MQGAGSPPVTNGDSPLEGGEDRQAQGDVLVGEYRFDICRDIPREPKRFPPPFMGESLPAKLRLPSKKETLRVR